MIANECFNCSDPNVGLSLNEDRTYVKCYMGDTGLLIRHTFDENEISDGELYREILLGKLSVNEGMFYENVIAQMLVAAGYKLYFYPVQREFSSAHRGVLCDSSQEFVCKGRGDVSACLYDFLFVVFRKGAIAFCLLSVYFTLPGYK